MVSNNISGVITFSEGALSLTEIETGCQEYLDQDAGSQVIASTKKSESSAAYMS